MQEKVAQKTCERLYGRRKGRPLHKRKAELVETLLPKLSVFLPEKGALDLVAIFSGTGRSYTAFQVEIGFGGGEHLAAQALAHPDIGFIGCEPFLNGVANLLEKIDSEKIQNIRIFPNDARKLFDALPAGSLARCFVLFPDPWPKARHAERRFINAANMDRFARVMKPDAELRLATDVAPLAAWMEAQASAHKAFHLVYRGTQEPTDWVSTRYEQKGRAAGRTPVYLCYRRVAGEN